MTTNFLGRTDDGDRVWVTINIGAARDAGPQQTIDHGSIVAPVRLSITGIMIYAGSQAARRQLVDSFGQATSEAARVTNFAGSSFRAADRDSLVALWERWHLNDMRAGCAHMEAVQGAVCDVSGYQYGTAWLVEPLPDDVVSEVLRLQSLEVRSTPNYMQD